MIDWSIYRRLIPWFLILPWLIAPFMWLVGGEPFWEALLAMYKGLGLATAGMLTTSCILWVWYWYRENHRA